MASRIDQLLELLGMKEHPEGGYYAEVWRSPLEVAPADGRGSRTALTTIYFLLPAGAVSRWHRVRSDEVWLHLEGAPLDLFRIPQEEWRVEHLRLGPLTPDQSPVHTIPANWWQAAKSLGDYTLVSCAVGPGFDFTDFELMGDLPAIADQVRDHLPHVQHLL